MRSPRHLVIFTKVPEPGRVKTRLIGELTPEQAAELHRCFVLDLVEELRGGDFDVEIAWASAEATPPPGLGVPARLQQGETLGERLFFGLSTATEDPDAIVAAVGTDHPELTRDQVEQAFVRAESESGVTLVPAFDGGYALIACRRAELRPRLFAEIEWSTTGVRAQTESRARELGLPVTNLPPVADIDTPSDLAALCDRLATSDACPRTRSLLASWGRLGRAEVRA